MAYEKTVWQKGMVLTAENLNKIENALEGITSVVSVGTDASGLNTTNTTTNNLTVSGTSNLGTTNISGATTIGTQETAADLNIYGDITVTGDVTFGTAANDTLSGAAVFNTTTATLHGTTTIDMLYTNDILGRTNNANMTIGTSRQLELEGDQGIIINSNTEGTTITSDLIAQAKVKTNEIIQRSIESSDKLKISAKSLLIDNYNSTTTSAVEIVPNATFDSSIILRNDNPDTAIAKIRVVNSPQEQPVTITTQGNNGSITQTQQTLVYIGPIKNSSIVLPVAEIQLGGVRQILTNIPDNADIPSNAFGNVEDSVITLSGEQTIIETDKLNINSNTVTIKGSTVATQLYVTNQISNLPEVAKTGQYSALIGTPVIPTVPTNISAFTNDAGYFTVPSYSGLQAGTYILQMTLNDNDGVLTPTYEWIPGE